MNVLMCSVGRRCELIKDFRKSLDSTSRIIATDNSPYAPALYLADKGYIVPRIDSPEYISILLEICQNESIHAVITLIDPEIEILSRNRNAFEAIGVVVLVPYERTAQICFDKFKFFNFLKESGIKTARTWGDYESFMMAYHSGEVCFPVFVKPRTGSGSVGARKIDEKTDLKEAFQRDGSLIVQEFMDCQDLDADVYVDTITHEAVTAFSKRKIETKIGGASKTISFKEPQLFETIKEIVKCFDFNGPIDMDFFYRDGEYFLSEINPRFGGAYLHAYGAGVDFIKLIENNVQGIPNEPMFGNYDDGVVMMMYDSVVICKSEDVININEVVNA